ncbi:uncharacterized protein LOC116204421 [Punica granatum]|uniref:Uncharacterized protein LOC116204421 n=1 Tax=Punica granatum TaxID=22663 RepID=A0A6P8D5H1_PUNGR|nr:uncharacterized protein LOC116204421 [Punica granatum]
MRIGSSREAYLKPLVFLLYFYDDLMIFMKGELGSIKDVLDIFDLLNKMFGLRLNPAKTEIFCAGMKEQTIRDVLNLSGFRRGSLPIRYLWIPILGIPIAAGRLSDKDYKPLIEKITILKDVEQKFRSFLWKGRDGDGRGVKVGWNKRVGSLWIA